MSNYPNIQRLSAIKYFLSRAFKTKIEILKYLEEKGEFVSARINDVLRLMLQIDKGLHKNKSGQLSKKIELSTLVEKRGLVSNYFMSDLQLLNKKNSL